MKNKNKLFVYLFVFSLITISITDSGISTLNGVAEQNISAESINWDYQNQSMPSNPDFPIPYPYPPPHPETPQIYLITDPDSFMINHSQIQYSIEDIFSYEEPLQVISLERGGDRGTTAPPWTACDTGTSYFGTSAFHIESASGDLNTGHCHLRLAAINIIAQHSYSHAYCWFKGSFVCTSTGQYHVNFNIDYSGIITAYDVVVPIIGWGLSKKFSVLAIAGFQIADQDVNSKVLYYKESFPNIGQYSIPHAFDEKILNIGYDEPITLQAGFEYEFVVQFNLFLESDSFSFGSTGGNIDLDCWLLKADIVPRAGPTFIDLVASETIILNNQLYYTIWTEPWYFQPGDTVRLWATIWNDGFHNAENFQVAIGILDGNANSIWFAISDPVSCPAGTWPNNAISFRSSPLVWPSDTNTYYIWCYADWYNDINELNEYNNLGVHPKRAQGEPDIRIDEITLIQCTPWPPDINNINWQNPEFFSEGDRITPIALVSNIGAGIAFNCNIKLFMDNDLFAEGWFHLERGDIFYVYVIVNDIPGFFWPDSDCHTFRWEVHFDGDYKQKQETYCPIPGDTIPPETYITAGPNATINYNDVIFQWTGTDDQTPTHNLQYQYRLDGIDNSWSGWISYTSKNYYNLPDGSYTFRVRARDEAGNIDPTPATRLFIVDTLPPETYITAGPSGTINYNDVIFQWTGTDDQTPTHNLQYQYMLDGFDNSWSSWVSYTSKNFNNLDNGEYIFYVRARDEAGNIDPTPASRYFTVDIWFPHWIPFDSHVSSPDWIDESYAYDDNVNTYARCPIDYSPLWQWVWTPWLELEFDSSKTCSKIRWYAWQHSSHCDRIDIKVYDNSAQVYSYQGEYTSNVWEERNLGVSPKQVTSVHVRFRVRRTLLYPTISPGLYELQMFLIEE